MESSASQRCNEARTGRAEIVEGVSTALSVLSAWIYWLKICDFLFNFDLHVLTGFTVYLQPREDTNSEVIEGIFLHHLGTAISC